MQYLHCRNCGAKVPVNWAGYRLAGIGICVFAVFGWFSFLFAGSGHAFLISCGIFLIGFILAKCAKEIARDMKKDGECPKCGQKTLSEEEPETVQLTRPQPRIPEDLESRLIELMAQKRLLRLSEVNKKSLERDNLPAAKQQVPGDTEERLLEAVGRGDADAANAIIAGKDFRQSPEIGEKALELAIRTARRNPAANKDSIYQVITSLFSHGAKASVSDYEFTECLAPEKRDFRLAAILAKYCVNMNEGNMLHGELATECRPEVVRFMVEHGADVNWPYKGYGAKPIQTAMSNDIPWVTMETVFSVMTYLMEKGAEINPVALVLDDLYNWQKFEYIRFALAYGLDQKYVKGLIEDYELEPASSYLEIDSELFAYVKRQDGTDPLSYRFRNWRKLNDKPFWHFFWYVPKRYSGLTDKTQEIRKMIYDFKDGRGYELVKALLKIKLRATFGPLLSGMVFLCIPASNKAKSDARYRKFSREICEELGMIDGYPHVSFIREKTPAHLGGTDKAEFAFDEDFFTFSEVILFDDVVTRGRSMREFKDRLQNMVSNVVCQISIGRTYNDWYVKNNPVHPWTHEDLFVEKADDLDCDFPF